MPGIAMVFPGQGSQYAGMGRDLAANYPEAREIFEQADDLLGYGLSRLCFEGPRDILDQTEYAQPAVLTCSMAAFKVLEQRTEAPQVLAGLSLGEYTALVAGGAIEFQEALALVRTRARLMQQAVPGGEGAMAAVLGLNGDVVEKLCDQAVGEVTVANYNAPGQVVISGSKLAVSRALGLIKESGGRAIPLAVSVPSHSPLMAGAARNFVTHLDSAPWSAPMIKVISNVTAQEHCLEEIPALLARQLYSPVLWEQSVRLMKSKVDMFIEVGPGSSLSALIKRIDRSGVLANVEDSASLEKLMEKVS